MTDATADPVVKSEPFAGDHRTSSRQSRVGWNPEKLFGSPHTAHGAFYALSRFLYGSVGANSLAIIAANLVLAFSGSVATLIPARRAAFANPLESLRSE
jgi:hypothetical protein